MDSLKALIKVKKAYKKIKLSFNPKFAFLNVIFVCS